MKTAHSEDDSDQYRLIAAGDIRARNVMAERHMPLVYKLASYYAKRNPMLDMDDLVQEGRIGVIIALGKYNVDSGYRFSTYAMWWIKHYIQRYVVSNHSRCASTSKKDTEAYLAQRMSEDDTKMYEARCISHVSMSIAPGELGEGSLQEMIPSDDQPLDEMAEEADRTRAVLKVLNGGQFSERDRAVIRMRFGLDGSQPHTLAQTASALHITPQMVGKIERRVIKRIGSIMGVSE